MAREPFERDREVEELLVAVVLMVELDDLRDLLDRLGDGEREVGRVGDQLGDRVGLGGGEAEDAADVLDAGARLERAEGDDLPDRVAPVLVAHILDDLAAPLLAEVDVDVGHRDAFRIEEALEEQVELERADVGDAERIGDERTRGRPAARPDRDATIARRPDEVGGDEEVARVARFGDDAELEAESLLDLRRQRRAVTLGRTHFRKLHEEIVLARDAGGEREGGQMVLLAELHVDRVGDRERVLEDVRATLEVRRDLGGALEEEPAIVLHAVGVEAVLLEADAEEHVVRGVVLGLEEVRVVGRDHREREVLGELEDLLVELALVAGLVGLDLEVVPVLEDIGVPRGGRLGLLVLVVEQVTSDFAGHAGAGDDQPLAVLGEELTVDAGLAVEALGIAQGRELDEVLVAGEVLREEDEVEVVLLARRGAGLEAAVAGGDVRLHADDRLESGLLRLLLELPRGVDVAVIGDRQRRLLELLGATDQVIDPVGTVEKRVL